MRKGIMMLAVAAVAGIGAGCSEGQAGMFEPQLKKQAAAPVASKESCLEDACTVGDWIGFGGLLKSTKNFNIQFAVRDADGVVHCSMPLAMQMVWTSPSAAVETVVPTCNASTGRYSMRVPNVFQGTTSGGSLNFHAHGSSTPFFSVPFTTN